MHTEVLDPEWVSTAHAGKQSSGLQADLIKDSQEEKRVLHTGFALSMQELSEDA